MIGPSEEGVEASVLPARVVYSEGLQMHPEHSRLLLCTIRSGGVPKALAKPMLLY